MGNVTGLARGGVQFPLRWRRYGGPFVQKHDVSVTKCPKTHRFVGSDALRVGFLLPPKTSSWSTRMTNLPNTTGEDGFRVAVSG